VGALNIHWTALTRNQIGDSFSDFVSKLKSLPDNQLTRLNQAGDLPGKGNRINGEQLRAITHASKGKRFFGYTHKPMLGASYVASQNRKHVKAAVEGGVSINLSANNLRHADELKTLGIAPVVTVIPLGSPDVLHTPAGHKVIKCPAQSREYVTCATCKLCAVANRKVIIGFEAHGNGQKYVSQVASA
jgi:hypothetical protein